MLGGCFWLRLGPWVGSAAWQVKGIPQMLTLWNTSPYEISINIRPGIV